MIAVYTVWYSFVIMHRPLKRTPALAAGATETLWGMKELAFDAAQPRKRPGRKPKPA